MLKVLLDKRNGFYAIWDTSEHGWQGCRSVSEYFYTVDEANDRLIELQGDKSCYKKS